MSEFTVNWFRENLSKDHLMGSKCTSCGKFMLPPRPLCPECGSTNLEAYKYKGTGTLKTNTMIHVPLTRFQEICPYIVGIVELDECVDISGLILCDEKGIQIGEKMEAVYLKNEDQTVLAFKSVQA